MERAVDVIMDIHKKNEIERLKEDINSKCKQIAFLLGDDVTWTKPVFYRKIDGKRAKIS